MNCFITFIDIYLTKYIETWRVELTTEGKSLGEVKIQRGIFLEDTLSPLLFVLVIILLSHILRKCTVGYTLRTLQEMINHLMYMDDIQLFAKNERE